jgi:cytochrome P450
LLLLLQNPDKLKWLREECDTVIKGRVATFDEAQALKRTNAVFFETLRMYPTVMSYPRECHEDYRMKSGWDIPKGSLVFVSQTPMNHDPNVWGANAEEFHPERFLGLGELQMSKPVGVPGGEKYGFAPFGGGQRTCVGARLGALEGVIMLSAIVKNLDWKLANPNKPIVPVAEVTLGPKYGLDFVITKRVE